MHTKNRKDKPNTNESSKFKVLLIYANKMMENLISINVSILSAALKQHGFDVKLFDTTFYRTEDESVYDIRVNNLQVRKFDLSSYGIKINDSDIHEDLIKLVEEYKPNLVGLSAVEETYLLGLSLLKSIKSNFNIPTIVGGVHTIFSPEEVLAQDDVDMICIGEGEEALVELCQKMQNGEDYYKVKNIWFKKDGVAVKNPRRDLMPLKDLPFLDFSIYDKRRMYRPMQGKIYKMLPIESSRGCPYTCTYCSASTLRKLYSNLGNYYRRKSVEQIIKEIQHYRKQYGLDFVYFTSESFLSMPDNEFENFVELYSEIKLPFWLQTRPESITKERIKKLETINCNRISVGLESGNEQLRKKMLKRNISNQQIIESLDVFKHSKIPAAGLDKGFQKAQQENKPILMYFWAVWCQYCAKFQTDTLGNPQVKKILENDYVLVAMDLDVDRDMANTYGVSYPPYLIFMDVKGNVLQRVPGAVDAGYLLPIVTQVRDTIRSK